MIQEALEQDLTLKFQNIWNMLGKVWFSATSFN